jgi:glucoamylase
MHFYTLMVQQAALQAGARIALLRKDPNASQYYSQKASEIQKEILTFWNSDRGFIRVSKMYREGNHGKHSELDIAVILACLHTKMYPHLQLPCSSDKMLITAAKLLMAFQAEYPINFGQEYALLGRYIANF